MGGLIKADYESGSSSQELEQTGQSCDSLRALDRTTDQAAAIGIGAPDDYYQKQMDYYGC